MPRFGSLLKLNRRGKDSWPSAFSVITAALAGAIGWFLYGSPNKASAIHQAGFDTSEALVRLAVPVCVVSIICALGTLSGIMWASRAAESLRQNVVFLPLIAIAILFASYQGDPSGLNTSGSLLVAIPLLATSAWTLAFLIVGLAPASRLNGTRLALERLRERHDSRCKGFKGHAHDNQEIKTWVEDAEALVEKLESDVLRVPRLGLDTGRVVLERSRDVSVQHRRLLNLLAEIALEGKGDAQKDARQHLLDYLRNTRHRLEAMLVNSGEYRLSADLSAPKSAEPEVEPVAQQEETASRGIFGRLRNAVLSQGRDSNQQNNSPSEASTKTEPKTWAEPIIDRMRALEPKLEGNEPVELTAGERGLVRKLSSIEESIDTFVNGEEQRLITLGLQLALAIVVTGTLVYFLLAIAVEYGADQIALMAAGVFFVVGVGGGQLFQLRPTNDTTPTSVPAYSVPHLAAFQGILVSGLVGVLSVTFVPVIEVLTDSDLTLVQQQDTVPEASPPANAAEPEEESNTSESSESFMVAVSPEVTSAASKFQSSALVHGSMGWERAPALRQSEDVNPSEPGSSSPTRSTPNLEEIFAFSNVVGYFFAFGFGALPGYFFQAVQRNIESISNAIGSLSTTFIRRPDSAK